MSKILAGALHGIGLMLPGTLIALAVLYRKQGLTSAEHLMVIGIISLLVFSVVGYGVLHHKLYPRFGRLNSVCFISWTFTLALTRAAFLFELITTDQQRLVNTVTALLFAFILVYIILLRTILKETISYLFPTGGEKTQ